ncbi:MAG: HepT-like ribonuclease domain-containing protein [Burkholderiales bacterium]
MNENRLPDYLSHMLDAARQACSYVEGLSKADFLADKRTQQAVFLNIVIIGEAAAKLLQSYADFLDHHPDIPWRNMKGMRNRIAHGYFDINLDVVWETVQTALPQLLERLPAVREDADDKDCRA